MTEKIINNETFGMSVEKSICSIYSLENEINEKRTNNKIIEEVKGLIKKHMEKKRIKPIEYIGGSGNQYDFLLENGKNLQVKSNYNDSDKVCPPKIGQCTKRTFILNVAKKIDGKIELKDEKEIKEFIFENIKEIMKIYIDAYYTSDYILYVKKPKKKPYYITTYEKINIEKKKLDECEYVFTKKPDNWNESSTVKIKTKNKEYSIGEFQIHNHRDNVKFRFNRNNFHNLIDEIYPDSNTNFNANPNTNTEPKSNSNAEPKLNSNIDDEINLTELKKMIYDDKPDKNEAIVDKKEGEMTVESLLNEIEKSELKKSKKSIVIKQDKTKNKIMQNEITQNKTR
jgi:hypothetical protein